MAKAQERKAYMATSVLDQIRAAEHQKVKVKTETLRKVKQVLHELNQLGFDYRVVGNGTVSETVGEARGRSKLRPAKFVAFAP